MYFNRWCRIFLASFYLLQLKFSWNGCMQDFNGNSRLCWPFWVGGGAKRHKMRHSSFWSFSRAAKLLLLQSSYNYYSHKINNSNNSRSVVLYNNSFHGPSFLRRSWVVPSSDLYQCRDFENYRFFPLSSMMNTNNSAWISTAAHIRIQNYSTVWVKSCHITRHNKNSFLNPCVLENHKKCIAPPPLKSVKN